MKKLLLFGFATVLVFTACKKKTEEVVPVVPVKTTTEKIQAVWKVTSLVYNDFYSNANHPFTQTGIATDYVDFRTNGKVYVQFGNPSSASSRDTSSYTIVNDNTIKIDTDNFEIKTLTANQLVLYNKTINSTTPLEYDESTFNLNK